MAWLALVFTAVAIVTVAGFRPSGIAAAGLSTSAIDATEGSAATLADGSAAIGAPLFNKQDAVPTNNENEERIQDARPEIENEEKFDAPPKKFNDAVVFTAVAGATVVGVALAPVVVPAIVTAAGFGASGIVANSWAAGLMSSYAGAVPAGSLCAVLQSIGTAGLSTSVTVAVEGAAASLAVGSAAIKARLFKQDAVQPNIENEERVQDAPPCKVENDERIDAPPKIEHLSAL